MKGQVMDTKRLFSIIGELYTRIYELEEEKQQLKLTLRDKSEQLELARVNNGQGQQESQRVSSK